MSEKFLVTGALGCIGSWAVKRLLGEGVSVSTYDLAGSQHRLKLILSDEQLAKVNIIAGDITEELLADLQNHDATVCKPVGARSLMRGGKPVKMRVRGEGELIASYKLVKPEIAMDRTRLLLHHKPTPAAD